MAAAAEKYSNHPIAREIMDEAGKYGLPIPDPDEFYAVPGKGVVAKFNGQEIFLGSTRFLTGEGYLNLSQAKKIALEEEKLGRTSFFVSVDNEIIGVVSLEDTLREDTLQSMARLKTMIPRMVMLTGDNYNSAYRVAHETGITEFNAQLLPGEKVKILNELTARGRTVAAVGDGLNDAPLLAGARVGIVMGDTASSMTIDAGSVVLLDGDFSKLPLFFKIARDTRTIIKQNIIVFAIIYNLASFFLASFGYLTPLGGAVMHNIGSTLVVLNSMRLLK